MGCPKPGTPFLGCMGGAGPLQPSQTKGLVWTAASALPSGQASQSTSSSGDWGQIKIINNNNRPLGPLQKRIAMATTCWQRCCLRPGGMDPHHHHHPVRCQMRSAPPTFPLGTKEIPQLWRNSPKATTFAVPRGHGAVPILLPMPRTMSLGDAVRGSPGSTSPFRSCPGGSSDLEAALGEPQNPPCPPHPSSCCSGTGRDRVTRTGGARGTGTGGQQPRSLPPQGSEWRGEGFAPQPSGAGTQPDPSSSEHGPGTAA